MKALSKPPAKQRQTRRMVLRKQRIWELYVRTFSELAEQYTGTPEGYFDEHSDESRLKSAQECARTALAFAICGVARFEGHEVQIAEFNKEFP